MDWAQQDLLTPGHVDWTHDKRVIVQYQRLYQPRPEFRVYYCSGKDLIERQWETNLLLVHEDLRLEYIN